VPAGFDCFPPQLIAQYLTAYANNALHISLRELLALGRRDPNDELEPFNMAYLAVRGSGAVNGVSRLHGEVSRRIFLPLFPRWPAGEVPVGHVTNGVHMPSWDSVEADELWTRCCGKGRWLGLSPSVTLSALLRRRHHNAARRAADSWSTTPANACRRSAASSTNGGPMRRVQSMLTLGFAPAAT
jgi:starch phosphorylase